MRSVQLAPQNCASKRRPPILPSMPHAVPFKVCMDCMSLILVQMFCLELLSHDPKSRTQPNRPSDTTYTAPLPFNCSRCFSTARFESRYRSTQFCVHDSSPEASFPVDIFPVMHFLKHISVRLWTAMSMICQPSKAYRAVAQQPAECDQCGMKTSNDSRKRPLNRAYILVSLPSEFHLG